MRLAGVPFRHEHIFDASAAPRGQLPYIIDGGEMIGDSETILAHLIEEYRLTIDAALTSRERDESLLVTRMLDDLYWVMSYSRWKDERYWPAFRDAFIKQHPSLTEAPLLKAREYNFQRYHFQGIGRYRPRPSMRAASPITKCWPTWFRQPATYTGRGPPYRCRHLRLHRRYYFYEIDTPLKHFVAAQEISSSLARHPCTR